MAKVMSYLVLEAGSAEQLEKMVEQGMEDGYQPFGGVSVAITSFPVDRHGDSTMEYIYAQAVVEYYDEN